MNDVTTSGLYLMLTGVIGYLFKLVLDRCYRAENQVDKGFGSLEKLTNTIELSGTGITNLSTEMAAMKAQHDAIKTQNDQILERLTALERRVGA